MSKRKRKSGPAIKLDKKQNEDILTSEEIEEQTKEFLKKNGVIEKIPVGISGEVYSQLTENQRKRLLAKERG